MEMIVEPQSARFAILRHESPTGLHWDLLLEMGSVLRTFALPSLPEPGAEIACKPLPDHRLMYLDYEGEISGGRGAVVRHDRGQYQIVSERNDELVLNLRGEKIVGRVSLRWTGE